jgi:hypothetical protein
MVTECEIEFADGRTLTCMVSDLDGSVLMPPADMGYGTIVRYRAVVTDYADNGDTSTMVGRWAVPDIDQR